VARLQEENLMYVMVTRSRRLLTFAGDDAGDADGRRRTVPVRVIEDPNKRRVGPWES
jgi:hypothetical protein